MPDDQQTVEDLSRKFTEATKPRSLFELVQRMTAVLARIDEAEGEVDAAAGAELDACAESLEERVEAFAAVCRTLKEEAEACARFAAHYTERAKRKTDQAERLKARLQEAMDAAGRTKITTPTATAALQKSPPSLHLFVSEEEAIKIAPAEYVETRKALRKDAIKAALLGGAAFKFARIVRGVHLRFR